VVLCSLKSALVRLPQIRIVMTENKIYILDTNVLVHDPEAIFSFEKSNVGIPVTVLEELDHFKSESTQRGRNTREAIRNLDLLRQRGSLREGVDLDNGGHLRVVFLPEKTYIEGALDLSDPDNKILMTALSIKEQGHTVEFISKDLNMRVKADVLGLPAFDYLTDTVDKTEFYKGWSVLPVPAIQLKKEIPDELLNLAASNALTLNEFVIVESQHNAYNNRVFRYLGGTQFKAVESPHFNWPIGPRNVQQMMALDLLLDDSIQLVTMLGPAGTGKTFLALVAALHKVLIEHAYSKLLVSRPVIPLGPDIGYLPGDIREKMHSWMQPVYDNMEFIVHTANASRNVGIYHDEASEESKKREAFVKGKDKKPHKDKAALLALDDLIDKKVISLEAITYMRGRSIPYQYILIDEVQNLTPHEVKTLVSRVGEGSKIILAGDPYQIDSPYLDFSSNGLSVVSQKFRGQGIFGNVFLETSERSELSKLAAELL